MAETATNSRGSITVEAHDGETEAIFTMSSNGLDNSSFQFTVEKLNEIFFREWAQSIKLVIDEKGS